MNVRTCHRILIALAASALGAVAIIATVAEVRWRAVSTAQERALAHRSSTAALVANYGTDAAAFLQTYPQMLTAVAVLTLIATPVCALLASLEPRAARPPRSGDAFARFTRTVLRLSALLAIPYATAVTGALVVGSEHGVSSARNIGNALELWLRNAVYAAVFAALAVAIGSRVGRAVARPVVYLVVVFGLKLLDAGLAQRFAFVTWMPSGLDRRLFVSDPQQVGVAILGALCWMAAFMVLSQKALRRRTTSRRIGSDEEVIVC